MLDIGVLGIGVLDIGVLGIGVLDIGVLLHIIMMIIRFEWLLSFLLLDIKPIPNIKQIVLDLFEHKFKIFPRIINHLCKKLLVLLNFILVINHYLLTIVIQVFLCLFVIIVFEDGFNMMTDVGSDCFDGFHILRQGV